LQCREIQPRPVFQQGCSFLFVWRLPNIPQSGAFGFAFVGFILL
jgi:hypothetical protein